jgi:hypothetical protein
MGWGLIADRLLMGKHTFPHKFQYVIDFARIVDQRSRKGLPNLNQLARKPDTYS